jgi:hypothetical protein
LTLHHLVQFSHHRNEGVPMYYRRLSALVTVATLAFGGTFVVAPSFLPESAAVVKAASIVVFDDLTDVYDANAAVRIKVALTTEVADALNLYDETINEVGGLPEGKTVAVAKENVKYRSGTEDSGFNYQYSNYDFYNPYGFRELETFSGWVDPKGLQGAPKPEYLGFLSPATLVPFVQEITNALSVYGYSSSPNPLLDQGVPGRYFASHAEKQILAELLLSEELPNAPRLTPSAYNGQAAIGVSRPMCQDCQYFYAYEARRIGKDFVVAGAAPGEAGDPGPSNRDPIRRVARYFHGDGRVDVISQLSRGRYQVKIYSAAEVDARFSAGLELI